MGDNHVKDTGLAHASTKDVKPSRPVWHSPAWITAIVGLVSVFLTVPDIIGQYLTKQQDIELAKEKTEGLRLGNIESKQQQEFDIVNSTLAQQGTERVFVLRYLASTLDDEDAKNWAVDEVKRLDDLASRQEALEKARLDFANKEKELEDEIAQGNQDSQELRLELDQLRSQLDVKNSEVAELRQKAGIVSKSEIDSLVLFRVIRKANYSSNATSVWIKANDWGARCSFEGGRCERLLAYTAPESFSITSENGADYKLFDSVFVTSFSSWGSFGSIFEVEFESYSCVEIEGVVECTRTR